MVNGIRGEVSVKADRKIWVLVATFDALCVFEGATGIQVNRFLADLQDRPDSKATARIGHLVHAMLLCRHPRATIKDARAVMASDGTALIRALAAAFPVPEADADEVEADPSAEEHATDAADYFDFAALLQDYVAAGFDPGAFWLLTPRLYALHMKGAAKRLAETAAAQAVAAYVGSRYDHRELTKYVDRLTGGSRSLPPELVAAAFRSASVGMPVISMQEYLDRKKT